MNTLLQFKHIYFQFKFLAYSTHNLARNTLVLLLLFFQLPMLVFGQTIPGDRTTVWNEAGLKNEITYTNELSVLDYGADSSGVNDSRIAFQNAINELSILGGGKCFVPAGTYFISNSINLKSNVLLIGEGSDNSIINISGNHGFNLQGTVSNVIDTITTVINKDDTQIDVNTSSNYQVGDIIKLYPEDGNLTTSTWALKSTGQMARIIDVSANVLTLHQPIRMDYPLSYNTTIRKVNVIENAGIHCVKINKINNTNSQTKNIRLNYAYNCSISGVESNLTNFAHISITNSLHNHISGCYFHHSHDYGTGGRGYGVEIGISSCMNLVENNIFKHLRHSILLQAGCNANVISYNYSLDPYKSSFFGGSNYTGDLVFHGNYPYLNLAEGNIMQFILMDISHGQNGPYNTIFRNRAELHGYSMSPGTGNYQHIVGLEVTGGSYSLSGSNHIAHLNNHLGVLKPNGNGSIPEESLFLMNAPDYIDNWPPIGHNNPLDEYSIDAFDRYATGDYTVCSAPLEASDCLVVSLTTNDMTEGSLRYAIDCAASGDTIFFDSVLDNQIIQMNTSSIIINKEITLYNDPNQSITINSNMQPCLFHIQTNSSLNLQYIDIEIDQIPDSAAIINDGEVIMKNISITPNIVIPSDKSLIKNNGQLEIKNQVHLGSW